MSIGPSGYQDLAQLLRDQIHSGRLRPGQRLPSEKDLVDEHGLARDTVRRAIRELRDEGLVTVRHGRPTRVREQPEREHVQVPRGSSITARMPTPEERRELGGLGEGVPVLEVHLPSGERRLYAADRVYLTVGRSASSG